MAEEYYKLWVDGYEIGDVIMIYRNANSVNARGGRHSHGGSGVVFFPENGEAGRNLWNNAVFNIYDP